MKRIQKKGDYFLYQSHVFMSEWCFFLSPFSYFPLQITPITLPNCSVDTSKPFAAVQN